MMRGRLAKRNGRVVIVSTEEDEQAAVLEWVEIVRVAVGGLIVPLSDHFYAVPNGAHIASGTPGQRAQRVARLRRIGFRDGALDLNLDLPRGKYHGCRVEMKSHGGVVTPAQHQWIERHNRAGYFATVAWGSQQAIQVFCDYLGPQAIAPVLARRCRARS